MRAKRVLFLCTLSTVIGAPRLVVAATSAASSTPAATGSGFALPFQLSFHFPDIGGIFKALVAIIVFYVAYTLFFD